MLLPGESKCTYGTGAFLLMNTGDTPVRSTAGLLTTVAWRLGERTSYALEGSSFIAGAAVQWLRDGLKVIKRAPDVEGLAASVKDSGDVVFVPALAGLGAPHWRPEARGLFAGIDRSTTVAHLARAVLEGIALQIRDLADAMRHDSGRAIPSFKVDGGAAANNLLMQYQADVLDTAGGAPSQPGDHEPGRRLPGRPGGRRLEQPGRHPPGVEGRPHLQAEDEARGARAAPGQVEAGRRARVSQTGV